MIELQSKWKRLGEQVGRKLAGTKDRTQYLKEYFDALNQSPKNTFIEIQNFCMEGLTQELNDDMVNDVNNLDHSELEARRSELPQSFRGLVDELTDLRGEFSAGCAWELVGKMSKL